MSRVFYVRPKKPGAAFFFFEVESFELAMVSPLDTDGPMFTEIVGDTGGELQNAFVFRSIFKSPFLFDGEIGDR